MLMMGKIIVAGPQQLYVLLLLKKQQQWTPGVDMVASLQLSSKLQLASWHTWMQQRSVALRTCPWGLLFTSSRGDDMTKHCSGGDHKYHARPGGVIRSFC
jgi:hypothetical protein